MKIKEIINLIEDFAPLAYAEEYDNVGLLVGNQNDEATGVLVCHDALENVIDEAISKNCNFIVCFQNIDCIYLCSKIRRKSVRATATRSSSRFSLPTAPSSMPSAGSISSSSNGRRIRPSPPGSPPTNWPGECRPPHRS